MLPLKHRALESLESHLDPIETMCQLSSIGMVFMGFKGLFGKKDQMQAVRSTEKQFALNERTLAIRHLIF